MSTEEACARRVRPPHEKYDDTDKRSHWSITMTLAWIIWGEIDAVRNQDDSYREKCADWRYVSDAAARAEVERIVKMNVSTGKLAPFEKLPKKLRKDFQKGSWHLCSWKPSGWNTLRASEHIRPQVARDELWQAAGEGRIKAAAIEYKNAKAIVGDLVEIPAHHWPHLKRADDPSGKPILSDDQGRIYREVKFRRLDVKELWPKSPLSGEPLVEHVENPEREQTRPAELELLEKAKPTQKGPQWERTERLLKRHYKDGTDGISTTTIHRTFTKDKDLEAELKEDGTWGVPSMTVINRVLERRKK
jgi:hypothetical protein